jgi:hypothetical protein
MRVRIALALALLAVTAALLVDMSGRAPRISGTDHVSPVHFVAGVPSRGVLCQPGMVLPDDTHSLEVLIGTYGHPVPAIAVSFANARGVKRATGSLPAGAREGYVRIPIAYSNGDAVPGTLCLKLGKSAHEVVFGGEPVTPGSASEQVDHSPQGGRIAVVYMRGGRESWWQLLGVLDRRFGLGKASLFGDWTLPAAAALLLAVWIAAVRVLARELA